MLIQEQSLKVLHSPKSSDLSQSPFEVVGKAAGGVSLLVGSLVMGVDMTSVVCPPIEVKNPKILEKSRGENSPRALVVVEVARVP